jgi:hypothetical protein
LEADGKIECTLAVLVRNEIAGSQALFDRIPWRDFEQRFVIDGHSTDGTKEFYEKKGIPVHLQPEPGLGAAMLEARRRCETGALVFFHPDGNEDPADLLTLRDRLGTGEPFVVASRMIRGAVNEEDARLFRPRKWANRGLALLANLFWGSRANRATDVTNGLRGIACDAWDRMAVDAKDCTMDFQMIIRALKHAVPISEFPTREGHRIGGQTNFASFQTGVAELKLLLRELFAGQSPARRDA